MYLNSLLHHGRLDVVHFKNFLFSNSIFLITSVWHSVYHITKRIEDAFLNNFELEPFSAEVAVMVLVTHIFGIFIIVYKNFNGKH